MPQTTKPHTIKKPKLSMAVRILMLAALILLPFGLYAALQSPTGGVQVILFGLILVVMAGIAGLS